MPRHAILIINSCHHRQFFYLSIILDTESSWAKSLKGFLSSNPIIVNFSRVEELREWWAGLNKWRGDPVKIKTQFSSHAYFK